MQLNTEIIDTVAGKTVKLCTYVHFLLYLRGPLFNFHKICIICISTNIEKNPIICFILQIHKKLDNNNCTRPYI